MGLFLNALNFATFTSEANDDTQTVADIEPENTVNCMRIIGLLVNVNGRNDVV